MNVGTRNCCRPVWPPGSSSIVWPVTRIGVLTVALKPPREVTRFRALTPFAAFVSAVGCWASAGARRARTSATTRPSESLMTMGPPPERVELSRARTFSAALAAALMATAIGVTVRAGAASSVQPAPGFMAEVVVTDVGRPIQLAFDRGGRLVVLSHGRRGDAAGEIHRLDVTGSQPIDAGRAPRVVIPFSAVPRKPALGSLAVDPRTGDLYLGEENGNRVYHLSTDHRLTAV